MDDEPEVCDVLTEALRAGGYGVRSFRDGSDALEAIDEALEPPRLVVLNLLLPYMSGKDLLSRIRMGRRVPDVPVVVITGMDVNEAYLLPFTVSAVLRKPVSVDRLLATIAAAVAPKPAPPK